MKKKKKKSLTKQHVYKAPFADQSAQTTSLIHSPQLTDMHIGFMIIQCRWQIDRVNTTHSDLSCARRALWTWSRHTHTCSAQGKSNVRRSFLYFSFHPPGKKKHNTKLSASISVAQSNMPPEPTLNTHTHTEIRKLILPKHWLLKGYNTHLTKKGQANKSDCYTEFCESLN